MYDTNALKLLRKLADNGYSFKFYWLGVKVVQMPEDLVAYQEIIFNVKPDLIIETGVLHGGSAIFFASMLELCGIKDGRVIGIDVKIREKTKRTINNHPLGRKINLLRGSSTSINIINRVRQLAKGKRVLVHLDSHHSHAHVLAELKAYAPLVNVGSYIIVADTGIEDLGGFSGYTKDNNPKTAVREFLKNNNKFKIDEIQSKLVMTGHPDGYLRRIR